VAAASSQSPAIVGGWVSDEVREEFPGLALRYTLVPSGVRRTPSIVKRQLEDISDRIDARRAVALRSRGSTAAYRVFQRQIGLDPDLDRTPFETAIIDRMIEGAFLPRGLPADACTIATIETGVPIWAIDAVSLSGPLGIRTTTAGSLVIADRKSVLAPLLGAPEAALAPSRTTSAIALFAVAVAGSPEPIADEALWLAAALASEGA